MNGHRRFGILTATVGAVMALGALAFGNGSASAHEREKPEKPEKVTICHASGREGTTKYETLELAWNAVYGHQGQAGHFREDGTRRAGHEQDHLGRCNSDDPDDPVAPKQHVTICHASGSETRSFVRMTVDPKAVDGSRHDDDRELAKLEKDHDSDHSHHAGDIIPPFYEDGTTEGYWRSLNWDQQGQAIFENDCKLPPEDTTTTSTTTTTSSTTTTSTTTTVVNQGGPTTTAVAGEEGTLPGTGWNRSGLLGIGMVLLLTGLAMAAMSRRPDTA